MSQCTTIILAQSYGDYPVVGVEAKVFALGET
jgi:hypothetical protein